MSKFVIGLTGGIGSGKTAVSDWFAQQGITVVDADVIAHDVVSPNQPALAQIVDYFGDWVLNEEGGLNRAALRHHVFDNPQALKQLESITHPAIRKQIKQQLKNAQSSYVLLVAPLLLESNDGQLKKLCQRILVVDTAEDLQIQRASQRDKQTTQHIKAIIKKQLPRSQRLQHADDVVTNNGSLAELYQQLPALHKKYLLLAAR